jgi:O-methyltransferase
MFETQIIRGGRRVKNCAQPKRRLGSMAAGRPPHLPRVRNESMSLLQQAQRTKHALAKALKYNYGRVMPYSAIVDSVNRQPLLSDFRHKNSSVPSFSSREKMWSFIAGRFVGAIDYLEFGVHRGHSILYFAGQNRSPASRFFGFDCFTGLPEDWKSKYRRGHFNTGGRIPLTNDARISFIVGMFQDTLPNFVADFKAEHRIIVHIDCDLYSSALYCLTKMDAALPRGTIIIFDEFGSVLHEFRAAQDYLSSYRRGFKVICSHDYFYTIAGELC